jgi:hypothetical protein
MWPGGRCGVGHGNTNRRRLTDDLDGTRIEERFGERVTFGLDGIEYEIDPA